MEKVGMEREFLLPTDYVMKEHYCKLQDPNLRIC